MDKVDAIKDALREANGKPSICSTCRKMRQHPAVDRMWEKHGRFSGLNWGSSAQTCPNDLVLAAGAEADQCSGGH